MAWGYSYDAKTGTLRDPQGNIVDPNTLGMEGWDPTYGTEHFGTTKQWGTGQQRQGSYGLIPGMPAYGPAATTRGVPSLTTPNLLGVEDPAAAAMGTAPIPGSIAPQALTAQPSVGPGINPADLALGKLSTWGAVPGKDFGQFSISPQTAMNGAPPGLFGPVAQPFSELDVLREAALAQSPPTDARVLGQLGPPAGMQSSTPPSYSSFSTPMPAGDTYSVKTINPYSPATQRAVAPRASTAIPSGLFSIAANAAPLSSAAVPTGLPDETLAEEDATASATLDQTLAAEDAKAAARGRGVTTTGQLTTPTAPSYQGPGINPADLSATIGSMAPAPSLRDFAPANPPAITAQEEKTAAELQAKANSMNPSMRSVPQPTAEKLAAAQAALRAAVPTPPTTGLPTPTAPPAPPATRDLPAPPAPAPAAPAPPTATVTPAPVPEAPDLYRTDLLTVDNIPAFDAPTLDPTTVAGQTFNPLGSQLTAGKQMRQPGFTGSLTQNYNESILTPFSSTVPQTTPQVAPPATQALPEAPAIPDVVPPTATVPDVAPPAAAPPQAAPPATQEEEAPAQAPVAAAPRPTVAAPRAATAVPALGPARVVGPPPGAKTPMAAPMAAPVAAPAAPSTGLFGGLGGLFGSPAPSINPAGDTITMSLGPEERTSSAYGVNTAYGRTPGVGGIFGGAAPRAAPRAAPAAPAPAPAPVAAPAVAPATGVSKTKAAMKASPLGRLFGIEKTLDEVVDDVLTTKPRASLTPEEQALNQYSPTYASVNPFSTVNTVTGLGQTVPAAAVPSVDQRIQAGTLEDDMAALGTAQVASLSSSVNPTIAGRPSTGLFEGGRVAEPPEGPGDIGGFTYGIPTPGMKNKMFDPNTAMTTPISFDPNTSVPSLSGQFSLPASTALGVQGILDKMKARGQTPPPGMMDDLMPDQPLTPLNQIDLRSVPVTFPGRPAPPVPGMPTMPTGVPTMPGDIPTPTFSPSSGLLPGATRALPGQRAAAPANQYAGMPVGPIPGSPVGLHPNITRPDIGWSSPPGTPSTADDYGFPQATNEGWNTPPAGPGDIGNLNMDSLPDFRGRAVDPAVRSMDAFGGPLADVPSMSPGIVGQALGVGYGNYSSPLGAAGIPGSMYSGSPTGSAISATGFGLGITGDVADLSAGITDSFGSPAPAGPVGATNVSATRSIGAPTSDPTGSAAGSQSSDSPTPSTPTNDFGQETGIGVSPAGPTGAMPPGYTPGYTPGVTPGAFTGPMSPMTGGIGFSGGLADVFGGGFTGSDASFSGPSTPDGGSEPTTGGTQSGGEGGTGDPGGETGGPTDPDPTGTNPAASTAAPGLDFRAPGGGLGRRNPMGPPMGPMAPMGPSPMMAQRAAAGQAMMRAQQEIARRSRRRG